MPTGWPPATSCSANATPKYGVLVPVLLAIYQRHFGTMGLGDLMHVLVGIEILYWIAALYLFSRWSRSHWPSCVLPTVLMLWFFWSASIGLHHPNHSPFRTAGIAITLTALMALPPRLAAGEPVGGGRGIGTGDAGEPSSRGSRRPPAWSCTLYRRYGLGEAGGGLREPLRMIARFAGGLLAALAAFALVYRLGCGRWPYLPGLRDYWDYANLSSEGYGSRPFRPETYATAYLAIWPFTIVAHAVWSVIDSAQQRSAGFRPSYRIAAGVTLLVWFAYFANRPDPEYISSYLLPYGLLLIDAGRYAGLFVRRPRARFGLRAITGLVVLGHAALAASTVIDWSWNPMAWKVKVMRAGAPMLARGEAEDPVAGAGRPGLSAVGLCRVDAGPRPIPATQGEGRRPIYFTVDSYMMPRFSGVLPLQEFADPAEGSRGRPTTGCCTPSRRRPPKKCTWTAATRPI